MKKMITAHLLLLTLLLGLTVAGLKFIDSCKDQLSIGIETIHGDASCLNDKKIEIRYKTDLDADITSLVELEVHSSDGIPQYSLSRNLSDGQPGRIEYNKIDIELNYGHWDGFYTSDIASGLHFPDPNFQINLDYMSIPQKYDPDGLYGLEYLIQNRNIYSANYSITMDGITYCTIKNDNPYDFRYEFEYNAEPESGDFDLDRSYPVEYTALSGIWACDETVPDATLQNVVPYLISSPEGPKVCGIYAIEKESAIVLLTIENNTDLYATCYDTKAKTARDPVLIFQSESQRMEVSLLRNNDTCPMGSIYIRCFDQEQRPSNAFVLSLQKNDTSGSINSTCYPFLFYQPYVGYVTPFVTEFNTYKIVNGYFEYLYYPEIFYFGDEIWMTGIEYELWRSTSSPKSYPESLNELYDVGPDNNYLIRAYKDEILFYEGSLFVDSGVLSTEVMFNPLYVNNGIDLPKDPVRLTLTTD